MHMSAPLFSGGVNVMTYDLSDDEEYSECPAPGVCTLDQQVRDCIDRAGRALLEATCALQNCQVAFYMATYTSANIPAAVGYETGTPAYPDPIENPSHREYSVVQPASLADF